MNRRCFEWVVRHCRWLGRVPLAPQVFDGVLITSTALFSPGKMRAMEALEAAILARWSARLGGHRFGGTAFVIGDREVAHLHGNGLLDIALTRRMAESLVKEGKAERHHVLGESSWVSYWIEREEQVPAAIELVAAAVEHAVAAE